MAIAIPIFTSELNKAKVARDKANIRAVKAAAVAIILSDDSQDLENTKSWWATGKWTSGGTGADLSEVTVTASDAGSEVNATPGHVDYAKSVVIKIQGIDLSNKVS